jgi:hypothetical protein
LRRACFEALPHQSDARYAHCHLPLENAHEKSIAKKPRRAAKARYPTAGVFCNAPWRILA